MAKPASIKIRLNSTADTGFFYVTKKNARTKTEKMVLKKYDPVIRKHVEFRRRQDQVGLATLRDATDARLRSRAFFV